MEQLIFEKDSRKRMLQVQNAFKGSGAPLCSSDRTLVGEGNLMKQGRKRGQMKAFFLFNDILVYGSIIVKGSWYKNQKITALEDIKLEDTEDSDKFKHQWLICTPRKSFYVSASSYEEKRAWMEHISSCQQQQLQAYKRSPGDIFAITWIPDQAAETCMRCFAKFTTTLRRHHCRKCGFVVCNQCSKQRGVLNHIHPTKQLRVCKQCHQMSMEEETSTQGECRKNSLEDVDGDGSSDYDEV